MSSIDRMNKYMQIIERAKSLATIDMDLHSVIMDIESADLHFNLRLDDWLNADNENFMHDFVGIVTNIQRTNFPATDFNLFVPRYAGEE